MVLWYKMGITHIERPEDWPVMNVHTMGISLILFGFFDRNPVAANRNAKKKSKVAVIQKLVLPDVTLCVPLPQDKREFAKTAE